MPLQREFLNWNRPALPAAVDYLVKHYGDSGEINLKNVIIAVPGARVGRRVLELLVARAEQHDCLLLPPEIITIGRLPERLYETKRPFAEELVQQLAWAEALRRCDAELVRRVTPSTPGDDDLPAWLALGEMLSRLHRELAAENLDFAAVAACGAKIAAFGEGPRWQALTAIQQEYLRTLDGLQLWDLQTARLFAIREGECRTDKKIVLLGTVDMNRQQRLMLDQVAERVTALVFAPPELAERFDEHGCIRPEAWREAPIELREEQIEVVDDAPAQAAAMVRVIAELEGRYRADQITVGVPDEQIVPYLQQQLHQCDVPVRYGVGTPAAESSPYRLLDVVAEYLDGRRFSSLAALVRHPAVQHWLTGRDIHADWLSEMDAYHGKHLPYRLGSEWLGKEQECSTLKQVHAAIEDLLRPLEGDAQGLQQWGRPILEVLIAVLGHRTLDRNAEPDRSVLAACKKIHDALRAAAEIPAQLTPAVSSADAVRLALRRIEQERIPAPPQAEAVELLGWLELPLDDAPVLVVTGFHDGAVPSSLNADLFLPNQLRRALGILDNDGRYARDAYALALMAASREHLKLITGRRSAAGDPLAPSRLLFACDEETSARRAKQFFSPRETHPATVVLPGTLAPGGMRSKFEVPLPRPLPEPVTSMRVTDFKDYLACPYRYYLAKLLRLQAVDDAAEELDGASFGSLAHDVLRDFGAGECADSADPEEIGSFLHATLDRLAAVAYGREPAAAIRIQIEQLRLRLVEFARWQADWAAQGWRIELVEKGPEKEKAALVVDGQPMFLRGRIDRIDVQQSSGRRMVFDYKTGDGDRTPEQTHCKGGEWIDLQLPLYRQLLRAMGIDGPVELAYIVLPKDLSKVGDRIAQWSAGDLAAADAVAAEVVRKVRAERFWPPATPPPPFSEQFAAICQDGQFGAILAAAEEEGGNDS